MHDYKKDEPFSRKHDDFWKLIYRKAFPDYCLWETVTDVKRQKLGIDRCIVFWGDATLTFDEKLRKPHIKEYPDILLEYLSNDQFNTPGWMEKDLECDYLAYAWLSTGKCWFLAFPALKSVWDAMSVVWRKRYKPHIYAWNKDTRPGCVDYRTWSVAVPIKELQRHLNSEEMFVVVIDNYEIKNNKKP